MVVISKKRFYILHFGCLYSLSCKGYAQFLKDASQGNPEGWDLDNPQYEFKVVKKESPGSAVFRVTDRETWEFKEEFEYFLQHQDVSPWNKLERVAI